MPGTLQSRSASQVEPLRAEPATTIASEGSGRSRTRYWRRSPSNPDSRYTRSRAGFRPSCVTVALRAVRIVIGSLAGSFRTVTRDPLDPAMAILNGLGISIVAYHSDAAELR